MIKKCQIFLKKKDRVHYDKKKTNGNNDRL